MTKQFNSRTGQLSQELEAAYLQCAYKGLISTQCSNPATRNYSITPSCTYNRMFTTASKSRDHNVVLNNNMVELERCVQCVCKEFVFSARVKGLSVTVHRTWIRQFVVLVGGISRHHNHTLILTGHIVRLTLLSQHIVSRSEEKGSEMMLKMMLEIC